MRQEEMLSFHASGSVWAIPIANVLEILDAPPLIRLPLIPDAALGIIGVRGSAITAVDVGRLLNVPCEAHVSGRSAILVRSGERRVALLVDSVDDIVGGEAPGATLLDLESLLAALDDKGWPA